MYLVMLASMLITCLSCGLAFLVPRGLLLSRLLVTSCCLLMPGFEGTGHAYQAFVSHLNCCSDQLLYSGRIRNHQSFQAIVGSQCDVDQVVPLSARKEMFGYFQGFVLHHGAPLRRAGVTGSTPWCWWCFWPASMRARRPTKPVI